MPKKILFIAVLLGACCAKSAQEAGSILIVDNGSPLVANIQEYLASREAPYIVATKDSSLQDLMQYNYRGVILAGGPLMYSSKKIDIEEISINLALLAQLNCPFLGICFGHQTIIESFGGKIGRMDEPVMGNARIKIIKKVELFDGLSDELMVHQGHNDCATEVPFNFDVIATSDTCSIEGVRHKSKPIFGVQFHPEASGDTGNRILDNFLRICKAPIPPLREFT